MSSGEKGFIVYICLTVYEGFNNKNKSKFLFTLIFL